jgi:hypothetical protein
LPVGEVMTAYRARPPASNSKLRTVPDGIRILRLIARLVREERPLEFFSTAALFLALGSVGFAIPIIHQFLQTGLVPRLPTAVLATGLMLLSFLSLTCGMVLATVTRGRIEAKRFQYLNTPMRADDPAHHQPALDTAPRQRKRRAP